MVDPHPKPRPLGHQCVRVIALLPVQKQSSFIMQNNKYWQWSFNFLVRDTGTACMSEFSLFIISSWLRFCQLKDDSLFPVYLLKFLSSNFPDDAWLHVEESACPKFVLVLTPPPSFFLPNVWYGGVTPSHFPPPPLAVQTKGSREETECRGASWDRKLQDNAWNGPHF